jgi:hypothetical protein
MLKWRFIWQNNSFNHIMKYRFRQSSHQLQSIHPRDDGKAPKSFLILFLQLPHCLSFGRLRNQFLLINVFKTFFAEILSVQYFMLLIRFLLPPICRHICQEIWQERQHEYYYSLVLMSLQFIIPLVVLVFTYARIAVAVWGNK